MNTTKYSVIVPHKNNFNGLQRLVKSIPEDEKIQIVLIDDNSEENIQKNYLKRIQVHNL
ncbi:hypothetical protein HRD57_10405 [Tetragenococcus halophilus]|nr:hypothetical protein [Tetragenococcus halophilus]